MALRVRIVLYGVNGSGVGHLTRLVAIARWLRRYALYAGATADIYFLTSSEATSLLFQEKFASFKVPSKTTVDDAGIDKIGYLALAKQWIWHSIGLLRPDLFVVDTFPLGSFGELLSALDLCRKKAFIHRPVLDEFADRPDFQAMLPLYDLLLVPEEEGRAGLRLPEGARAKTKYLGPILSRERVEWLGREAARARLGIGADELAMYVSAGGGGDGRADEQIRRASSAARRCAGELGKKVRLVIGAGPLHRGERLFDEDIRWITEPGISEILPAVDGAIAAAGYNTYHELLHAGIPTVFWPQRKIADDQIGRAKRAVAFGASLDVDPDASDEALASAVLRLFDPEARESLSRAARAFVPRNHARDAAAELLRLSLPRVDVDAAEAIVTDDLLGASRELGISPERFVDLVQALAGRAEDRRPADPARARDHALALARAANALGAPLEATVEVCQTFSRRLLRVETADVAELCARVLTALAPFSDFTAAVTLIKLLRAERRLEPLALADELLRFFDALRAHGHDLYAGVAMLSAAQGLGRDSPSNQDALRRASARAAQAAQDAPWMRPAPSSAEEEGGTP